MKESKAIYVTKHRIRDDQNPVYQLCTNHNREQSDRHDTRNIGCQYDIKRDNDCTCRNISPKRTQDMRYFSGVPKQVYAYHGSRSFADIGVGSVKALQRRKVKRVYLPETDDRGVGSSDLSSFILRRNKQQKSSYYDHKRTSSKCVGGFMEYNSIISQKLSPIVQTRSGSTSPKMSMDQRNIEIGSNTIDKNLVTTGTQFEIEINKAEQSNQPEEVPKIDREKESPKKAVVKASEQTQKYKYSTEIQGKIKTLQKKVKEVDKVYSSDSLLQHVHNLENPSDEKQSRASIDPMEKKLEREYRRMFSTKYRDSKPSVDKPIPEFNSASILRQRFEALRRGSKKDDGNKSTMPSSQDSVLSRKDASVTSDPPSLEGRSFTDTKRYSPTQANIEQVKNKINHKTKKDSSQWPQTDIESECQDVKGMFNLWGKKFNFDEEAEKVDRVGKVKQRSLAIDINKKPHKEIKPKKETENKKGWRRIFFFKKKNKDQKQEKPTKKENQVYTSSEVTAGRCEINDGLIMKMGCSKIPKEKVSKISEEGDEIQRRTWFKNFVTNRMVSARSVNVRWNNSMYATSSSTVFELMDTIYKNNGVVLKSRSEIISEESSYYRSYKKNKVYFDQNIEAWMIPKMIPDRLREIPVRIHSHREIKKRDVEVTDHRWSIEKSKAFANKIEVVLHSKNFNRVNSNVSSEYLRIDIPKNFFDVSSSDGSKQNPTSDEVVYKIVEYESDLKTKKKAVERGDHASEIEVIVNIQDSKNLEEKIQETVIKRPPTHRDVVIQGSNVNIPKRCDVIGVGIITQRDLRESRKPILKIQDDLSEDDSDEGLQINPKKCEFAESYLQEYYRNWTPLGIDLFSWCVSDSNFRSCSEKSLISFHNQGDGSKSCPNICENFQTSTIISSCNTSSCSQCYEEVQKVPDNSFSSKLFKKFIEPLKAKADIVTACQRVLPKNSLEVFKRRKMYAASLKSQWACSEDKPVSVPSIESKGAQKTLVECPKSDKPIISYNTPRPNKDPSKKHVSMLDSDKFNEMLMQAANQNKHEGQAVKCQPNCDACIKKGKTRTKQAVVNTNPTEIPQPACKDSCEKTENPACAQTNSPPSKLSSSNRRFPAMSYPWKPSSRCQSPCSASLPHDSQRQCPPTHLKARKKISPNAQCIRSPPFSPPLSPSGSKGPSPKTSHDCLSPARLPSPEKNKCVKKSSLPRNERLCPKCQKKQPCFRFPNCKLSPAESIEKWQGVSQQKSPKESPSTSPLGSLKKNNKKTSPCDLPPCNQTKKTSDDSVNMKTPPKSPCESDQFPWPMKNQVSNPTSPSHSETSQQKDKNKLSSLMPKTSNQSLALKTIKQCKPDCASRKKKQQLERKQKDGIPKKQLECPENKQQPCPTKQQQPCLARPQRNPNPQAEKSPMEISKTKISGLFLKMKPFKRTCSKECLAWESQDEHGVVRLNSREKITISMKQETPSTEEIREGMNIKVQDDDGITLFERKDYTCGKPGHKSSVLGDMYKDSKINRVSTPVMVVTNDVTTNNQEEEVAGCKSNVSLANMIEIQLKLRITQGDKTTEINIANEDEEQQDKGIEVRKTLPEVFLVETSAKEPVKAIEEEPKNNIDIKIVVKNFKPKLNKTCDTKKYDDMYSKNISDKFQSVSTGYSDIITDEDDDNVFSIHTATIDLDSSNEKSKTLSKLSNEVVSEELTIHEPMNFMVSLHSTEHLETDITEDENVEKSVASKKDTQSYETYEYTNELDAKDLDTDQDATLDLNTSNECNDIKYNSKEEKKELLKKVFDRVYSTPKNRENVRQLRDSLKIILTDSSENEINAASNELAKDVTYASLKPDYFRNTDSINNYYKIESSLTEEESQVTSNILYPTEENNSCTSGTSKNIKPQGCMCSRVAERLNCDLQTGCCCRKTKIDETTSCDIRNEQDILLFGNRTTDYVDVQTQNSNRLCNHSNQMNLSLHNHESYSVQNESDAISIAEKPVNTKESKTAVKKRENKTFSPRKNHIKECEMKKLNRATVLGISDDDKIVLLSERAGRKTTARKKDKDKTINNKIKLFEAANVMQCFETKKAVLEIYAEKTMSENGEHFVAKLPKFVYEKESEITRNFKEIATGSYRSVCKRNVFRMTVNN